MSIADQIKAGLLAKCAPATVEQYPRCFQCDRPYSSGCAGRVIFCSLGCVNAFDQGVTRNVDLPTSNDRIGVDLSRCVQVAGPPIMRCDACGGLAADAHYKGRKVFCHWRCRDGKPRDCEACGKSLYNLDRRGPYCSTNCANNRGTKNTRKAHYTKSENSAQVMPMEYGELESVGEEDEGSE